MYAILGKTVAPGGRLFQIIILTIGAYLGGWLISLTTLPALIGMLFIGILFQNIGFVDVDESFSHITKELRCVLNISSLFIYVRLIFFIQIKMDISF